MRDLVRSRGLGDVYKRQVPVGTTVICDAEKPVALAGVMGGHNSEVTDATQAVSYTHLTLPTSDLV